MTADELLQKAVRAGCVAAWGRPTDCLYPHCICGKATESETATVLRLALEEAAKAVCVPCEEGWPLIKEGEWHVHPEGFDDVPCDAAAIRALMPPKEPK